jgi:hypothetical protein
MIGLVSNFIVHTAYTVDACALASILPSPSLIGMIYCTTDTKPTPASVQRVGVDFQIDIDFAYPQRCETCNRTARFHSVFGGTYGYEVSKNWVRIGWVRLG